MRAGATLRKIVYGVAPRGMIGAYHRRKMMRHARTLVALRDNGGEPREWIDELLGSHFFRPMQKRSEILRLVEIVDSMRPSRVCEIGAARGGTAFLFAYVSAPDAKIISVDLDFGEERRHAVESFARLGQTVICLRADSHSEATLDAVRSQLDGALLDILYLDGDHSYKGVVSDYQLFSPLVRRGGLIVLHDIIPDYHTRFGVKTNSETGGVPRFWRELRESGVDAEEIVEDEEQDGFGIGIIRRQSSSQQ